MVNTLESDVYHLLPISPCIHGSPNKVIGIGEFVTVFLELPSICQFNKTSKWKHFYHKSWEVTDIELDIVWYGRLLDSSHFPKLFWIVSNKEHSVTQTLVCVCRFVTMTMKLRPSQMNFMFCWPCIPVRLWADDQLDAQLRYVVRLLL